MYSIKENVFITGMIYAWEWSSVRHGSKEWEVASVGKRWRRKMTERKDFLWNWVAWKGFQLRSVTSKGTWDKNLNMWLWNTIDHLLFVLWDDRWSIDVGCLSCQELITGHRPRKATMHGWVSLSSHWLSMQLETCQRQQMSHKCKGGSRPSNIQPCWPPNCGK